MSTQNTTVEVNEESKTVTLKTLGTTVTVPIGPGQTLDQAIDAAPGVSAEGLGVDILLNPSTRADASEVNYEDVDHNAEYTAPPKNKSLGL